MNKELHKQVCKELLTTNKWSVYSVTKAYKENRQRINAYLRGDVYEGFDHTDLGPGPGAVSGLLGGGIAIFIVMAIIVWGLWIWALVVTIIYFKTLPTWAKVLSVIGLCVGIFGFGVLGTIMTLIVVYVVKKKGKGSKKRRSSRRRSR